MVNYRKSSAVNLHQDSGFPMEAFGNDKIFKAGNEKRERKLAGPENVWNGLSDWNH
jgi:hypothetical protein